MNTRITFAIVLILLGIGFILDTFNFMEFSDTVAKWWPLIIIIFGISHLSKKNPPIFSGLIIIGVGVLLLAERLDFITGFWHAFWPLLLIIAGISILLPGTKYLSRHKHQQSSDGDLNITTIFGGQHKRVDDQNFKGGNISSAFAGVELDLSHAELAPEGAVLNLNVAFGAIEISIPKHWKVESSGTPIFGAFEDKTYQDTPNENTRTLHINYNVIFGAVEMDNQAKHKH